MEHVEIVPKSFGCSPHKSLKLLKINSFRSSKSGSSNNSSPSSPRSPKSPNSSIKPRTPITKDNVLNQVFRRFDENNDGKISALELRSYFASIGEYMSYEEAYGVIMDNDSDGDKLIDFQDFEKIMKIRNADGSEEEEEDLKAAFEKFELDKGSGRITPKSLQKALSRLGDSKTYDDCVSMIQVFDTDGNGELDFHEFHQMMAA